MSCTDVQTIQAGNGTKTQFSFDFPYIFKSEIHVYFWNATTKEWDEKLTTDGTYPWRITDANPTIVEFTSTAPPSPTTPVDPGEPTVDNVKIRRITNLDDIRALFNPGSAIRSDDLNNNFEQLRYAIQESNCPGVPEEVQEYLEEYYWDRFDNTLYSADTWRSDDATIATTAALDARFQDEVAETITSTESWPSNDDTVGTTLAVENRVTAKIDDAITNDIAADSSGITITDDGDGTITLSIEDGDLALTKIDPNAVITSAETWANNDDTIATTAKIDDVIDDAITGDILIDTTGLTKSTSGGQTTLGIGAGSVDIDRIKAENIITEAEQDSGTTETDDNLFTAVAAAKRFDTLVQTNNPGTTTNWEVGKTWLQNDDDLTLSIYNGTGWTAVTSGGTFTEQPSVVYVDQASGDDNNTGHRISTPKATIRAAINQINADIDVEITNGGSGYVESTYNGVSLTGGTGTGLTADIVVNASGVVTTVTVNNTTTLEDYNIGDVLSANNADLGGSGSGLQITVTGDGDGQIVIVSAGTYQEIAPIQIKRRNVSVIGQALRSCIVHPTSATENNVLFELNSGSYIANLTLTGMQAGTGTGNTLDAVLPTDQGWNFAFYNNAFITKSPYIQNCTNFSDSEIDNDDLRSHRPRGGQAGDTDSAPTGGGLLVNGATPHADSPLRSMVADSYTHVALNGPGILVTNNGYTQITSSYAFFNTYHIKCLNGGQANLAASTTDFGDRSLVADGRSTSAIFTSNVDGAANDGATTFNVNQPTAGTGWFGDTQRPAGNMLVEVNSVTYPILSATPNTDSEGGDGWTVTISRPDPNNRSNNLGLNGAIADDAAVSFFLRSMIASSGHTMEYVGSGTNYTALPENGGVPNETRQITELNNGKVWTAITDHNGKFRIGGNQTDDPIFEVDQQLGFVTIPEGSIAFNLLSDETPQLGGNLDVNGNTITSTSNANVVIDPNGTGTVDVSSSRITNVTDPTGAQDAATKNYVDTTTTANPLYVAVAGDTMSGELAMGTNKVTGVGDPTAAQDAATKNYVDTNFVADAGGTMTGNLDLNDNVKARFGTGNDLEIFHNGSNSFIKDGGTGDLYIQGDGDLYIQNAAGTENKALFRSNGAATLYYDNSAKLATTSTGIDVTGTVTCDGLTCDSFATINTSSGQLILKDTNSSGTGAQVTIEGRDSTNTAKWQFGQTSTSNENLRAWNYANAAFDIATNNVLRFRVQNDGNVVPAANNSYDLGSSSLQWRHGWFDGVVTCDGISSDGTTTLSNDNGQLTVKDANTASGVGVKNWISGQSSDNTEHWYLGQKFDTNSNVYYYNVQNADLVLGTNNTGRLVIQDDGHVVPNSNNAYDLGTSLLKWKDGWFDGVVDCDGAVINGKVRSVENTATASSFDLNNGNFWTFGAIAVPNPTNQSGGMSGLLRVTAAPTSFAANWNFPGGSYTAPTSFPAVAPFFVQASGTILVGNWTEGIA